MKAIIQTAILTVALGLGASAFAAEQSKPEVAFSHGVNSVEHLGQTVVVRGTTAIEVLCNLGYPSRELSAEVWAYDRFFGGSTPARPDRCTTLLLTFGQDKIVKMELINPQAEKVIVARIEQEKAATLVAKGKGQKPGGSPAADVDAAIKIRRVGFFPPQGATSRSP
jgi:hypothetical protein